MAITIDKIRKAAIFRYQLDINDDQALAIKYKIFENSEVQLLITKIKKLPANFISSGLEALGMLAIFLGVITIFLALTNQTSQFLNYLRFILQGFVIGQLSIYTVFYIFYYSELNKLTKKLMYVNLASYYHDLRTWKI